jgi:hypothetical protein
MKFRFLGLIVSALTISFIFLAVSCNNMPAKTGVSTIRKVEPQIPIKATGFDLTEVRLLDSPIKEKMELNRKYLVSLDVERLLHNFRVNAGLPSSAKPLAGWEEPNCELRGHFTGHYLSACALMYSATGEEEFKKRADYMVAELAKCQKALGTSGYLSAYPESFIDRVEKGQQVWAPYYTLHKIMAGLIDVYTHCGNKEALDLAEGMAKWCKGRCDKLSDQQMQRMLNIEFGGMGESFANLYEITGKAEYMAMAKRFDHKRVIEPLSQHIDKLRGLHVNTQVPKVIAAAREYELTGEPNYYDIAEYFWSRASGIRAYCTGGTSNYEYWRDEPGRLSEQLSSNTHECCVTYNMLKLSRELFGWEPDARFMDYYEKALYNGIFPSQSPIDGGATMYYLPLKSGLFKLFNNSQEDFVCCSGTGIETFSKLADTIYFHDKDGLYVNLFIPSKLNWKEKGITVTQETKFPQQEGTSLVIESKSAVRMLVRIRIPYWVVKGLEVKVNGVVVKDVPLAGTFLTIDRKWNNGDRIDVKLPMGLHLSRMPDNFNMAAIMYGPIVLAGEMGDKGMTKAMKDGFGEGAYEMFKDGASWKTPVLVTKDSVLSNWIKPVEGQALRFKTAGAGKPDDVNLMPLYQLYGERYAVYFDIYTPAEWQAKEARKPKLLEGVIDTAAVGEKESESDHNFQAYYSNSGEYKGRKWVQSNDWFRYDLDCLSDKPMVLECTYAVEDKDISPTIMIDGADLKIAPAAAGEPAAGSDFYTAKYDIPEAMTKGKNIICVQFTASQPKDVAVGETTVEKPRMRRITPKVFGLSIIEKKVILQ